MKAVPQDDISGSRRQVPSTKSVKGDKVRPAPLLNVGKVPSIDILPRLHVIAI